MRLCIEMASCFYISSKLDLQSGRAHAGKIMYPNDLPELCFRESPVSIMLNVQFKIVSLMQK